MSFQGTPPWCEWCDELRPLLPHPPPSGWSHHYRQEVSDGSCAVLYLLCIRRGREGYIVQKSTEYTECWPCPLFDILLNKYIPAG
jgi:hypothetical protein